MKVFMLFSDPAQMCGLYQRPPPKYVHGLQIIAQYWTDLNTGSHRKDLITVRYRIDLIDNFRQEKRG